MVYMYPPNILKDTQKEALPKSGNEVVWTDNTLDEFKAPVHSIFVAMAGDGVLGEGNSHVIECLYFNLKWLSYGPSSANPQERKGTVLLRPLRVYLLESLIMC